MHGTTPGPKRQAILKCVSQSGLIFIILYFPYTFIANQDLPNLKERYSFFFFVIIINSIIIIIILFLVNEADSYIGVHSSGTVCLLGTY